MSHASIIVALDGIPPLRVSNLDVQITVAHQMAPFDENTTGTWFADGTRWDWWVIGGRYAGRFSGGDTIRRGDLNLNQLQTEKRHGLGIAYDEAMQQQHFDPVLLSFLYGIQPGETRAQYINRCGETPLTAYAFLRNQEWHEQGRMGWWGMPTRTEAERGTTDTQLTGTMVCQDTKTGARIFTWGEEGWEGNYYGRFIEPLPAETLLVMVDYHV